MQGPELCVGLTAAPCIVIYIVICQVIHVDMPTALNAVERASIEFETLGHSLNRLSGPLKRAAVPAVAIRGTLGTGDGIRRVAQDVTALTQVSLPDLASAALNLSI